MRGSGSAVAGFAERDATIVQLRADLVAANQRIQALTTQNTQYRTELDQISAALQTSETQRRNVTDTISALGFEADRLPPQASESIANVDDLRARMKSETDPKEKHKLAQQIRALTSPKKEQGN